MHIHPEVAFWQNPLSQGDRNLIYYFLVFAGLALLAMFVRTWTGINEASPRYRPALFASLGVTGAAFLSYVVLTLKFDLGYTLTGGTATGAGATWLPNKDAIWSWAPRYMDWSVTVPLLMVEVVAVSALVGVAATRMRTLLMVSAFLMIFTGYLGGVALGDGNSLAALWTWGIISGVFMVILYIGLITIALGAKRDLSPAVARTLRLAIVLQLVIFFAYPIIFGFQGYTGKDGGWTVAAQITLSVADVIAKVGFGSLIHKVVKQRTAEDLANAEDTHPESVYISNEKKADALLPHSRDDLAHLGATAAGLRRETSPAGGGLVEGGATTAGRRLRTDPGRQ